MSLQALVDDEPAPSPPPTPTVRPPMASRGLPASFEAVLGDELGVDDRDLIARGATVPAMDAVAPELHSGRPTDRPLARGSFSDPLMPVVSLTPLPMLSAPFQSGPMKPLDPQPYPSGELLVPAHGTPPGTSSSSMDSLPAHMLGLPPSSGYPSYEGSYPVPKLRRSLPGWVIPVAVSTAAAVVIGIVAAVAG